MLFFEKEFENSEDENAGKPYTNRGRNDDVIHVLMVYGFSAEEMKLARPKKVGLEDNRMAIVFGISRLTAAAFRAP